MSIIGSLAHRHGDMLMRDGPSPFDFSQAKSRAHPILKFRAIGMLAAAMDQAMGKSCVLSFGDFQFVQVEQPRTGRFRLPLIPTLSIGCRPLVLERRQHVVNQRILRVIRQNLVVPAGPGRFRPLFKYLANLLFIALESRLFFSKVSAFSYCSKFQLAGIE